MKQRLINIIAHVAGWGLLLILVLGFAYRAPGSSNWMHSVFSWPFVLFAAVFTSLFYLNIYVLIPAFYLRRRFLLYFSIILLLLAGVSMLRPFDRLMKRFPRVERTENIPNGMRQNFRPILWRDDFLDRLRMVWPLIVIALFPFLRMEGGPGTGRQIL